jgi:3-phosphoshikimate 1-carboxyvinyltransferase
MAPLLDALSELGVTAVSESGRPPLSVHGPLLGGDAVVDGKSSQFVTALLIASPLAPRETRIRVRNLHERPYVEMTIDWLRRQKIVFTHSPDFTDFRIAPNQAYQPFDRSIPADFSTAAFPLLAAAVTGGEALIRNLDFDDYQGDKAVFDYVSEMGMKVEKGRDSVLVRADGPLRGIEIDLNATPDALPAMAVAAAFAKGRTVLKNVAQARIKETDRIRCMTLELRKMGITVEEMPDGMIIEGGNPRGAAVDGYDDHRIVMALAIAGLAAEGETTVEGAAAAAVTYPEFLRDLRSLGADISEIP